MRRLSPATLTLALALAPVAVRAAGPTIAFTLPAQNATPSVFGSLPFPNDLYFDQGRPGDGDGTLINAGLPPGAKIGLSAQVVTVNTASIEDALDLLDGFGTTSGIYFFASGPLDGASLPASPVLVPSLAHGVFCADTATLTPVPVLLKGDVDSRIPNVLGILPLPGRPLRAKTTYVCVVRTSVTGGGQAVASSADWVSVRDGASANGDADALFDPVVTALGVAGVPTSTIAGMTVFTTQSTTDDLVRIRDVVLPGLPVPAATFPTLYGPPPYGALLFYSPEMIDDLLGPTPHAHIAAVGTAFFASPRFQTLDPNGNGPLADLPDPPGFVTCSLRPCETTDERFTRDASGNPIVITTQKIPVTVVIPKGSLPAGGFPVIIQQHGLGGQRDTVVQFAEEAAARGFVSIGIDAAQHGYRYFNCPQDSQCSQDNANNFGGTTVPDGFVDGTFADLSVGFLTTNLGFFQAFHNFLGVRDNLRQTYADLLQLVRLIKGHSIDLQLGAVFNDQRIYFVGHSLGALMGAGFVPIEADLKASVLNAGGGGLITQLFQNSSVGGGNQALVNGILGLDPVNVADQFGIAVNLIQAIVDPADGVNSASLLLDPVDPPARNVLLVEDYGDQVLPNQANEALAIAAGLPIFDPFVQNLHHGLLALPVVPTPRTVRANAAGGTATAALLQNGPATHAASTGTVPGTLTFAPDFGHWEEFPLTGDPFPTLERGIRVPNAGIFDELLDWFKDIQLNGPPGRFSFGGDPNFNPVENAPAPAGASSATFFARTVSAGGAAPFTEPTPDVTVALVTNAVATRLTAGRSILGSTAIATEVDVPPGPQVTIGTLGVLPFFATVQRELPGTFTADVTLAYTTTELGVAGVAPGSSDEAALVVARFQTGTCTLGGATCSEDEDCGANGPCVGTSYTLLPTTVDTGAHTATAPGLTAFSTFAVVHPDGLAGTFVPPLVPGSGATRLDCRAEWQVINPTNTPFRDAAGRVSRRQSCRDGDAACDADRTVNGICSYRIAVCLNRTDPTLPDCPGAGDTVVSYTLASPTPGATNPLDAASAGALLDALVDLGGTQGGLRQNVITFAPPLSTSTCAALRTVQVPTHGARPGRRNLRGIAQLGTGARDVDRLKLSCAPAS